MEQRSVKYTLGSLSRIEPKTFGEPGRRTFHLAIEGGTASCILWLEKELLNQLGVRLQEVMQRVALLERESDAAEEAADDGTPPAWSGDPIDLEFKAGQLALEYDEAHNQFGLSAFEQEVEEPNEDPASISFWITTDQATTLAAAALSICAAGRPLCFLCGQPIDPDGHFCPRSNGHTVFEAG